jgi:hypothetical protein
VRREWDFFPPVEALLSKIDQNPKQLVEHQNPKQLVEKHVFPHQAGVHIITFRYPPRALLPKGQRKKTRVEIRATKKKEKHQQFARSLSLCFF